MSPRPVKKGHCFFIPKMSRAKKRENNVSSRKPYPRCDLHGRSKSRCPLCKAGIVELKPVIKRAEIEALFKDVDNVLELIEVDSKD
jgi:hypothetical protein